MPKATHILVSAAVLVCASVPALAQSGAPSVDAELIRMGMTQAETDCLVGHLDAAFTGDELALTALSLASVNAMLEYHDMPVGTPAQRFEEASVVADSFLNSQFLPKEQIADYSDIIAGMDDREDEITELNAAIEASCEATFLTDGS